jgi:hypothetical protein
MPGKGDQTVGMERIRVMTVAACGAKQFTANFTQSAFQLAAIPRGIFAHRSRGENELIAKRGWNRASGFQQRLQVSLGGLLETQQRLPAVLPVRVTSGQ